MKKITQSALCALLFCLCFSDIGNVFAQQENVFYSIRRADSHLVTIDTLGNVNDIGYIGFSLGTPSAIPMDFDRCGRLIMLRSSVFYELNIETGLATSISTLSGVTGSGSTMFTFGANNELYVFREVTGNPQGTLYLADLATGAATAIGGTSGVASILSIEADESGNIWGFEELLQKLVRINPLTGAVDMQSSGSLAMVFPTEIDYNINKGQLWGYDIVNSSSTIVEARSIDLSTGVSSLRFTLSERFVGMATYTASVVAPRPTISASGATQLCPTETVTLTSSIGNRLLWSTGDTTQSITVDVAGQYFVSHIDTNNCQVVSIDTIDVVTLQASTGLIDTTVCFGGTFEGYSMAGTYTDTLTNAAGCDSIRTINLSVRPANTSTITQTICAGQSLEGYTTSGTYNDVFTAADGCDSTRTLVLTVTPAIATTITQTICAGQSFEGYITSGTYTDGYTAADGCDSTRTLVLTVTPAATGAVQATICNGQSYFVGGANQTVAGTYYDTIALGSGCDSIVVTTLTLNPSPALPTIQQSGATLSIDSTDLTDIVWFLGVDNIPGATNASHTATENGTYYVVVSNSFGCAAISDTVSVTGVGIADRANTWGLKYYPNPTNGQLTLEVDGIANAHFTLHNSLGQTLHTGRVGQGLPTTLHLGTYAEGVYYLKVQVGSEVITKKVMLVK